MDVNVLIEKIEALELVESDYGTCKYNEALSHAVSILKEFGPMIIEYSRKVKVPRFVADWIVSEKGKSKSLMGAFNTLNYSLKDKHHTMQQWVVNNQEMFAQAWLDGYEVEEEPKYYVELPGIGFLIKRIGNEGFFVNRHKLDNERCTSKLTRAEVCILNSNYLAFAVPVK